MAVLTKDVQVRWANIDTLLTIWNEREYDQAVQRLNSLLVQGFRPETIFLFGSHVWGNPHSDSDLDLLIIVPKSDLSPAKRASTAYRCLSTHEVIINAPALKVVVNVESDIITVITNYPLKKGVTR